ncbi:MAG TPA: M36 family metallopeptidase [Labilithrix sp.]|nr:M36 family metallopeptidase [Labilithrix sp.]
MPASRIPGPDVAAPVVVSRDAGGASTFLWAGRSSATRPVGGAASDAAREHLVGHASLLGISAPLARGALLAGEQALPGGGTVVTFKQRLDGIDVFRTRASVILDGTNNLVAISGNLRPAALAGSKVGRFTLTPEQALAKAYRDRFGATLPAGAVTDVGPEPNGEYRAYRVATADGAPRVLDTARVRKVYVAVDKGSRLVAAYHCELLARVPGSKDNAGWLFAIAADDGRTLVRSSLTAHEKFTYRVWADATQNNIPTDGPLKDSTPVTGTPATTKEAPYAAPILVSVDGFNKNAKGTFDPWLGAAATETKGNNVDAYSDRNSADDGTNDGFDAADMRADVTAAKTFDRAYNPALQPDSSPAQIKAAITQIFYVTNWMHDFWYDSGFDEKAGNAQAANYGRGGKEGDVLLAEAQDGADQGQSNNANMSTFSDGRAPRMQMYVWDGVPNNSVTATPAVAFTDRPGNAVFGPQVFDLTGASVLATPADACAVPGNVSGKIAVIDRGNCDFVTKAQNAQAGGAVGVVLVNNAAGHNAPSPGVDGPGITIPLLGISLEDGVLLKTKLGAGAVSITMKRGAEIVRDGTIDNGVVAHEWGHYLHHRLVDCGSPSCDGMSEGWADFNALLMVIKGGDALDGTAFPLTQYAGVAGSEAPSYFGIRRAPYSSDTAKNPFTFKHIRKSAKLPTGAPLADVTPDMSESHNVGEVWAEALFEAYTNILRDTKGASPRLTFDQAKRRMADYIVAGMMATPPEPTFVEQRDALLAVAYARDVKDFTAMAKGFAKRGLGVGAVAPPVESDTLDEAVEDTSFKGSLAFVDARIDDAVRSCDRDGYLDADEKGDVTIRVKNAGWVSLASTTVTVTTPTAGVTLANGGKGAVATLDPFGVVKVRIGISFDPAVVKQTTVPVTVTLANADSFKASVTGLIEPRVNFDVAPASATTDDVESPTSAWTFGHGLADPSEAWARMVKTDASGKAVSPPDFRWHGDDLPSVSDESLVSPDLVVSATVPFKISFKHKYSFENGPDGKGNPLVYFDGGVIEISSDGGKTWADISTLVDPGYTQSIYTPNPPSPADDNPLSGRMAYAGLLATWTPVTLDLGTQLAGKTVKVRFRLGSDGGTSDVGWDVDDLAFAGITNKPFPSLVDDGSVCKGVPIAVAGPAQTVAPEATVKLDASGSSDPDKDPITFAWEQLDGPEVELTDPTTDAKTGFTAPKVTAETKLLFRVTVADAKQAASDTVEITVRPADTSSPDGGSSGDLGSPGAPAPPPDDGCGCRQVGARGGAGGGGAGGGALGLLFAGALALVLRARRRRD